VTDVVLVAPLFSIIVPTLNVESVIHACLASITAQTFADFEVVLVDGGSTDKTRESVATFVPGLGRRLAVHAGKDDGVYDAMNRGIERAAGEWLLFLGADDTLHGNDALAQVAAFIRGSGTSHLVYGDVLMRSTSSRYGGVFDVDRLLFAGNLCHQSVFYRRELFTTIGPYNLRYRIWADWDFNIRCFGNPALVTRHMDLVVANYNDTGGLSMQEDPELKKRLPVFILAAAQPTWTGKLRLLARDLLSGPRKRPRSGQKA
jgi:glycosyltransferase involved in cell wall biosynthesis